MKNLTLSFLLLVALNAQATTYYIDFTGGIDANNGRSITTAWKTLGKWNTALPGDTVLFKRGETWTGNMFIRKSNMTFAAYGTGALPTIRQIDSGLVPIYIDSQSHLTFRNLRLVANQSVVVYFGSWSMGADGEGSSYILIDSCTILGPTEVYGAHNTIQYCTIDGTTNNGPPGYGSRSGIFAHHSPSHHNVFKGNIIHRFDRTGIHLLQHTHDDQILNNTVYDINGYNAYDLGQGIDIDSYSDVSWRNTVSGNTIYGCTQNGISLENCFDTVAENNLIYNISNGLAPPIGTGIGCILYSKGKIGGENNQYGANGDLRGMNTNNIIRQNQIHDIAQYGIVLYDTGTMTVDKNVLSNNGGGDIFVTGASK